ncbi:MULTISPECIES: TROVE domain-containing protein [unclassified Meiothermus]|uniref:TROVE domain-containing protein n=1 Tax=unclassified Meiothermus TaxID=370471 RepID=UPI001F323A60|nr:MULTISPECIES: TROVE domain-containing protein [unclassified Meiothermus]
MALLAAYARQVLGLRSGPAALLAHLFWWGPTALAEEVAPKVWLRGDEHLETLAYTRLQGWKIRKSLKVAVAQRLNRMSPYALVKYRREGHSFSQRDALILCHPKPLNWAHAMVYEWLIRGKRALPEAQALVQRLLEERPYWERVLSQRGSHPETWRQVLPYLKGLSLLRNLGNLHRHGLLQSPEVLEHILTHLGCKEEVKRWQIFPHQWLLAIFRGEEEDWPSPLLAALEEALEATLPEVHLEGESLVLVDVSGSMYASLSQNSQATYALAASSLGALLYRRLGGRLVGFDGAVHPVRESRETPIRTLVQTLLDSGGGGTYLGGALQEVLPGFSGPRVVIFTDEQVADDAMSPLFRWLRQANHHRAYVINVAGYAPLAFPQEGLARLAGFSERLLELLPVMETGDARTWMEQRLAGLRTTASVAGEKEDERGESHGGEKTFDEIFGA